MQSREEAEQGQQARVGVCSLSPSIPLPLCLLLLLVLLLLPCMLQAQPLLRHDIQVVLQPEAQRLQVTDTITLPVHVETPWHFLLHAGLQPVSLTPGVRLTPQPVLPQTASTLVPLAYYAVTLPP